METIGAIAIILLVLACPLGMLAIGGVAWFVARARGDKRDFSMNCMQHGGHGEVSAQSGEGALRDQVAQLQAEIEFHRSRIPESGGTVGPDTPNPGEPPGAS